MVWFNPTQLINKRVKWVKQVKSLKLEFILFNKQVKIGQPIYSSNTFSLEPKHIYIHIYFILFILFNEYIYRYEY